MFHASAGTHPESGLDPGQLEPCPPTFVRRWPTLEYSALLTITNPNKVLAQQSGPYLRPAPEAYNGYGHRCALFGSLVLLLKEMVDYKCDSGFHPNLGEVKG